MVGPGRGASALAEAVRLVGDFDWKSFEFASRRGVPQPVALRFLLSAGLRLGAPEAERVALLGLDALVKSEAFDDVEGGFFASCAASGWREPDTAKPLLLNCEVVEALAAAAQSTGREDLLRPAAETAAWIDRALGGPDEDLWADGLEADPEYYALMVTQRSRRRPPAQRERTSAMACCAAVSALAALGATEENRSRVARARLALGALIDGSAGAGGPRGPDELVALGRAMLDVFCLTGDRTIVPDLQREVDRLASPRDAAAAAAPGPLACLLLREARRRAPAGGASGTDLLEGARRLAVTRAPEAPAERALFATAVLASEAGVIAVEGVAGSSLASGAYARCLPFGPAVVIDTAQSDNDENRVVVRVPGRPAAVARRRSDLSSIVAPLRAAAAAAGGGGGAP